MSHETFKEGGWGGAEWKSSICDRHTTSIGKENASETTDAQRNISFRKLVLGVMEKAASSLRATPTAPLSYWPLLGKRNIWRLDEAWRGRAEEAQCGGTRLWILSCSNHSGSSSIGH